LYTYSFELPLTEKLLINATDIY